MTSVTAGLITCTCVQVSFSSYFYLIVNDLWKYRHAISTIADQRVKDWLFDHDEFYDSIIKMLEDGEDEDPEWGKNTFEWWNV